MDSYQDRWHLNKMLGIANNPPCSNCGKFNGGFMGSSLWGHDYPCCSESCGQRLGKRIENGMFNADNLTDQLYTRWGIEGRTDKDIRIEGLRLRIKILNHRLVKQKARDNE